MSMPATNFEIPQYFRTLFSQQFENPLDALIADSSRRQRSPVYRDALARFGFFGHKLVQHLTSPGRTREQKVQTLPDVGVTAPHGACDWAVNSVMALAVLVRLDLYIQDERESRNLSRTHDDRTGKDLLEAICDYSRSRDDDRLVALIANEASCFLHFVEDPMALEASIRGRLDDFKKLAKDLAAGSIAGPVRVA